MGVVGDLANEPHATADAAKSRLKAELVLAGEITGTRRPGMGRHELEERGEDFAMRLVDDMGIDPHTRTVAVDPVCQEFLRR